MRQLMRSANPSHFAPLIAVVSIAIVHGAHPLPPARATLSLGAQTRLLIASPHPDDEVLGAAGVIQRVRAAGGALRIVYLTNGEGFPLGVQVEEGRTAVKPSDFRDYGRERKDEARNALRVLGVDAKSLTFLGFPNGGLNRLMTAYWSDRHTAYRSPYTRRDRPWKSEGIEENARFRGEDLTQELAVIIGEFKPTTILVPRREDQHGDHCAAWYFVGDALGDVERVDPGYHPDLITYIIHYNSWPFEETARRLPPPPGLSSGRSGWLNLNLTDAEIGAKRRALDAYKTQMKVMRWFLEGFIRENELFSRPQPRRVVLPVRRSVCDQYIERSGH